MAVVIAAIGAKSKKLFNGEYEEVTPFMGADREGKYASLGIGFFSSTHTYTWGLVGPHNLIQSWRAMKILEKVPDIQQGTLCHCWYAAKEKIYGSDIRWVEELATQFSSNDEFEKVRNEALNALPSPEAFDAMLIALREKNVSIDSYELTQLIKEGKLSPNPLIDQIVKEEEETTRKYRENEALARIPVPEHESLSVFFADLKIANFIIGQGIGGYGIDWGHIELRKLDETAKEYSLGENPYGYVLQHTTEGPETIPLINSSKLDVFFTSFGEIEFPYYVTLDGMTKYTFLKATFRDGSFQVETRVEEKGKDPIETEWTVLELREMIGTVSPKVKSRSTFWDQLRSRISLPKF